MFLAIDFQSDTPIYMQLKHQIIAGIARGELKEGENLPSVRQLAQDIGINLHTVNKAYSLLKDGKYVLMDYLVVRYNAEFSDESENVLVTMIFNVSGIFFNSPKLRQK